MIDIQCCPSSLKEGFHTYSPRTAKLLFDGKKVSPHLDFDLDELRESVPLVDAMNRISVSGVQEKFPAIINEGKIQIASSGERSTHILKPAPWDETLSTRKQIPANEHLTMQIAAQVYGIQTAANGLCFTRSGQAVYITRRFDVGTDGTKFPMEDISSVIKRSEQSAGTQFKYTGCYEDIAQAIRQSVAAWMVDMERFLDLVVFNYIYGNGDAHLKNFSLIQHGKDCRLAPAYDLLNTALHINGADFALDGGLSPRLETSDVMARTGHPCRLDFERFGQLIGLSPVRIRRILDKYMCLPEVVRTLIGHSFLNDKMKRSYLRIVEERVERFIRNSE
jgi:serine/threonine-protein kinase HipA